MKSKKANIFANVFLCGADAATGILSFFEGKYTMGTLLLALGIGLGYLGWRDLHE